MKRMFTVNASNRFDITSAETDKPVSKEDVIAEMQDNVEDDFDFAMAGVDKLVRSGDFETAQTILNQISMTLNDSIISIGNNFEQSEVNE